MTAWHVGTAFGILQCVACVLTNFIPPNGRWWTIAIHVLAGNGKQNRQLLAAKELGMGLKDIFGNHGKVNSPATLAPSPLAPKVPAAQTGSFAQRFASAVKTAETKVKAAATVVEEDVGQLEQNPAFKALLEDVAAALEKKLGTLITSKIEEGITELGKHVSAEAQATRDVTTAAADHVVATIKPEAEKAE